MASQDQAINADRRRVGSINRNWTNYKADVPLYAGGNALGWGVSVVLHYLSELFFSVVLFSVAMSVFESLVSLTLDFSINL